MSTPIIESKRLLLRQFTPADSDFILQLLNSENWIKYIGNRNVRTPLQAIDYLNNGPIKSYETNGFGLSLVALRAVNTPIGMCGLLKRHDLEYTDIGFAFLPQYTQQGYAYEIAEKTLQYGFDHLQLEKILAITDPLNSSSIRLLEKLGLQYEKMFTSKDSGKELLMYGISRNDQVNN